MRTRKKNHLIINTHHNSQYLASLVFPFSENTNNSQQLMINKLKTYSKACIKSLSSNPNTSERQRETGHMLSTLNKPLQKKEQKEKRKKTEM